MKIIKIFTGHITLHFYVAFSWWLLFSCLSGKWSWQLFLLSIFGAIIIDFDHIIAAFLYDRRQPDNIVLRDYLRKGQFLSALRYGLQTHKNNTFLLTYNIYVVLFLIILLYFSQEYWGWFVFLGAIITHLIFDMVDDLWVLNKLNRNWLKIK